MKVAEARVAGGARVDRVGRGRRVGGGGCGVVRDAHGAVRRRGHREERGPRQHGEPRPAARHGRGRPDVPSRGAPRRVARRVRARGRRGRRAPRRRRRALHRPGRRGAADAGCRLARLPREGRRAVWNVVAVRDVRPGGLPRRRAPRPRGAGVGRHPARPARQRVRGRRRQPCPAAPRERLGRGRRPRRDSRRHPGRRAGGAGAAAGAGGRFAGDRRAGGCGSGR